MTTIRNALKSLKYLLQQNMYYNTDYISHTLKLKYLNLF